MRRRMIRRMCRDANLDAYDRTRRKIQPVRMLREAAIPAKAGIHGRCSPSVSNRLDQGGTSMESRFRGNDGIGFF